MSTNARREIVLALLINGFTKKAAAESAGINEKTVRRWLQDPEFSAELKKRQDEISESILLSLKNKAGAALATLENLMQNEKISPHARVTAARTILESALKSIETHDIYARLEEVEKCVGDSTKQFDKIYFEEG